MNKNPSCFKKRLGVEACNHGCPVSDECYKDETINDVAHRLGRVDLKNKTIKQSERGSVL